MQDETKPVDDATVLWRYVSLSKLVALFSQRALYLSRSDGFGDPFEGALGGGTATRDDF